MCGPDAWQSLAEVLAGMGLASPASIGPAAVDGFRRFGRGGIDPVAPSARQFRPEAELNGGAATSSGKPAAAAHHEGEELGAHIATPGRTSIAILRTGEGPASEPAGQVKIGMQTELQSVDHITAREAPRLAIVRRTKS